MKYLLDTNTCIRYIKGASRSVFERLNAQAEGGVAVCAVVKAELFYGTMHSQNPSQNLANQQRFLALFASLPFDDSAATHYGRIRAELARAGTPIGGNDLMIAAIAIAHNLTLVSHNLREFGRVHGLKLEDWETPLNDNKSENT